MKCTAQQIYDKLINDDKVLEKQGQINFHFADIDIIVKQRDVVGNIIEEWLRGWFDKKGIEYALSDNTQMPPDFFLNPDNLENDLLEVKAFNIEASPGFDIASFDVFANELAVKPYMLFVDYLIFGYKMDQETGTVTIEKIWIKKVWEICRRMEKWPLNLQIKDNVVHKIRPGVWDSRVKQKYQLFRNKEDFLSAIEETMYQNPKTHNTAGLWKPTFLDNYKSTYGMSLKIPKWDDIADSYINKK